MAFISDTDYYTMPFVAGLAGGQEKGGAKGRTNPNVPDPFGARGKDHIQSPQASLSLILLSS